MTSSKRRFFEAYTSVWQALDMALDYFMIAIFFGSRDGYDLGLASVITLGILTFFASCVVMSVFCACMGGDDDDDDDMPDIIAFIVMAFFLVVTALISIATPFMTFAYATCRIDDDKVDKSKSKLFKNMKLYKQLCESFPMLVITAVFISRAVASSRISLFFIVVACVSLGTSAVSVLFGLNEIRRRRKKNKKKQNRAIDDAVAATDRHRQATALEMRNFDRGYHNHGLQHQNAQYWNTVGPFHM